MTSWMMLIMFDDQDDDEDGDVGTQNQSGASGGDDGDGAGERGDAAEDDTRITVSRKRRRQVNFFDPPCSCKYRILFNN